MTQSTNNAPKPRALTTADLKESLKRGIADFAAAPMVDLFFASFFVLTGMVMFWITYATGTTFLLVLAVMGFPLVGTLAALGFYETSRLRMAGEPVDFNAIRRMVWSHKNGQLPWLATIIVVIFLFWFFLSKYHLVVVFRN